METRLLIRGEQVAGEGTAFEVENPTTEETAAEVGAASPEQLDAAIAAAREAARGWAATPAVERAELLHEVATRMRALTDDLARALTLEGGKPLIENSDEVGWTAAAFDYYAEMGRNFAGRVIPPIESSQLALVVKEPIGPWACIVPWNYPLLLLSWKVAPAIAAGNTVVAKPSELGLHRLDAVLELEDAADTGQADALVGQLLDPAQQRDVALGVPPAPTLGARGLDEPLALVDAQRLRVHAREIRGHRDDVERAFVVRHVTPPVRPPADPHADRR